jgi:hypothetical protein
VAELKPATYGFPSGGFAIERRVEDACGEISAFLVGVFSVGIIDFDVGVIAPRPLECEADRHDERIELIPLGDVGRRKGIRHLRLVLVRPGHVQGGLRARIANVPMERPRCRPESLRFLLVGRYRLLTVALQYDDVPLLRLDYRRSYRLELVQVRARDGHHLVSVRGRVALVGGDGELAQMERHAVVEVCEAVSQEQHVLGRFDAGDLRDLGPSRRSGEQECDERDASQGFM